MAGSVSAQAAECGLAGLPSRHLAKTVRIDRVSDGDTVRLASGEKIRLIGINTPELHQRGGAEPFATAARQTLNQLLADKRASIVVGQDEVDNHGRTLAHLFDSKGQSVEARLIAQGLGWHVAIPPNLAQADCLAAVEKSARQRQLGVWSRPAVKAGKVAVGGFQRISGTVTKVTLARNWWISLDNHLVAVVYPQDQKHFSRAAVAALRGHKVEVRGWVYPSRSKKFEPWRIKLQTPHGISAGSQ